MKSLWLSWEHHRRSRELARCFGAQPVFIAARAARPWRYFAQAARTLATLGKLRPDVVFCQNPSIVLTALLVALRPLFGYCLIVDRHSNFRMETARDAAIKWRVFHWLSRQTVKRADFTLVTTPSLARLCRRWGGRAEVLPDKIPDLGRGKDIPRPACWKNRGGWHVMCVTTFGEDEPIEELIEAKQGLPDCTFYLTGNFRKKYGEQTREQMKALGIEFTGFIEESAYKGLMAHSDVVVVLTRKEHVLNCGAYEALALGKPLVLAKTRALEAYFGAVATFTGLEPRELAASIRAVVAGREEAERRVRVGRERLAKEWEERFAAVDRSVKQRCGLRAARDESHGE